MSDDLIKRSDVIEVLAINAPFMSDEAYLKSYDALKSIPSADRPQGEWIKDDCAKFSEMCNQCGFVQFKGRVDNYCPNCGAKMKGAGDEV